MTGSCAQGWEWRRHCSNVQFDAMWNWDNRLNARIPVLDLMFFLTEKPDDPKHVGIVMIMEPPKRDGGKAVRDLVAAFRAARAVPPFNRIALFSATQLPQWVTVDRFDMDYHIQHVALPEPGSYAQLHRLIEDLHAPVLDRSQPGWKMYFIEGLEDSRFAIYGKIHHSLIDGQSGMARLLASLAMSPKARVRPFFAVTMPPQRRRSRLAMPSLDHVAAGMRGEARAIGEAATELARKVLEQVLGSAKTGSRPFSAPHTPMNQPILTQRSLARVSLPLQEMHRVARAWHATINDVAICVVDAALGAYLAHIGRPVTRPLVHLCPVSLHEDAASEATTRATAIWIAGARSAARMSERMAHIVGAAAAAKQEISRLSSKDAAYAFGVMAFMLQQGTELLGLERMTNPLANVVLSNLHGPAETRYVGRARLVEMIPVSTLAAGIGLNITFISYAGTMQFGFVANRRALPELDVLAANTRHAFDRLVRARPTAIRPGRGQNGRREGGEWAS